MECLDCNNQGWILSNNEDWNDEIQKCDNCNVLNMMKKHECSCIF